MTISFKTLFWIGFKISGLNYLYKKCQRQEKRVKTARKIRASFAGKLPLEDSSDDEDTNKTVSIGKFVEKMYKANAMYFDV